MCNMASRSIIKLLCVVLLLLHQGYGVASDPLNIAYNKTTAQSSEYLPHPAWLAVDGNTDGTQIPGSNRDGEFSHTSTDPDQWWSVDLGQIYYVYRVKLWSRVTHLHRLSHISILSSTDVNPPPPSLSSDSWISLSYREEHYNAIGEETFNDPASARHLAVFNSGTEGVTLVEFQAFGVPTSTENNIAELKKTSGSASCISAASLVDGDLTTESHSCSDDDTAAQWEVDLGVDYDVTTIRLHCADCDTNGVQVKKDSGVSTNCTHHSPPQTNSAYFDIHCDEKETARQIILEYATNVMKLITEVQIFGSRSLNYALTAHGAVAEQSSDYGSAFSANHANDGQLSTLSHTTETSNEWLKIYLSRYLYVTDVVIHNRQDCCEDRTRNTTFYTMTDISSNGGPAVPDWSVCLYRAEEITTMNHIRCDNNTQPLAVQVAIQVGYDHGVTIAEFEVYGLVPGDFDGTPRVTVMSTNCTHLVLVIHQWLNNMTGDVPPTSTVLHDTSSDTVEVVIDSLSGSEGYDCHDYKILAQHGNIIMKDLASVNVSLHIPSDAKLHSLTCPAKQVALTSPENGLATFRLKFGDEDHILLLPLGLHAYIIKSADHTCNVSLTAKDYRVQHTLEFVADYTVDCGMVNSTATWRMLEDVAKLHYSIIETLCDSVCNRTEVNQPIISCDGADDLKIRWPTDLVFPADVVEVPADIRHTLVNKIKSPGVTLDVVVWGATPPVVYPNEADNGGYLSLALSTECINGLTYIDERCV